MSPVVAMTGGTGFLGLNVAEDQIARGRRVVLIADRPPPEAAEALLKAGEVAVEIVDVTDEAAVETMFRRHAVTHLIHGAAITAGPDRERAKPDEILRVNILGTVSALRAAWSTDVARAIVMSSSAVYGHASDRHQTLVEDVAVPDPVGLYGISKLAAERSALRLADLRGLDIVAVRLGALYGRWEWQTGLRDTISPPVRALSRALRGEPVTVRDGSAIDWLYPTDAAAGLDALLFAGHLDHRLFNLSGGTAWTLGDWMRALASRQPQIRWQPGDDVDALAGPARKTLDIARVLAATDWRPVVDLEGGLTDLLAWVERYPGVLAD